MRTSSPQYVSYFAKRIGSKHSARTIAPSLHLRSNEFSTARPPSSRLGYWVGVLVCFGTGASVGVYLGRPAAPPLDKQEFSPFILKSKQPVSSTASIFTLLPNRNDRQSSKEDPYEVLWNEELWSVQAKQPQLQIARDYTPLPPSVLRSDQVSDESALRILIRHEENGEMSSYLHRLPRDAQVELRGPHKQLGIDSSYKSVIFCAGGTGIAPAMQCIYALLSNNSVDEVPKIHLLWANRKREDCEGGISDTQKKQGWWSKVLGAIQKADSLESGIQGAIVKELEALKELSEGRLTVDYFVDEEQSYIKKDELKGAIDVASQHGNSSLGSPSQSLILVSGPDAFISYLAGPKAIVNGFEVQGALGGLLKSLVKPDQCIVWKL